MYVYVSTVSKKFYVFLFICFLCTYNCTAQLELQDSTPDTINKQRLNAVLYGGSAVYAVTMVGFYELWYSDFETTSFHFFNDNREWQYMDKLGHVGTSYQLSKWGQKLFIWTGMPEKKSAWYGVGISTLFQTSIEVLDGFSSEWGFSVGDVAANTLGSGIFVTQELLWQEQKVLFKFSFHNTNFPKYRPSLLGQSQVEKVIKDYNGQTIWLSANVKSFVFKEKKFPDWLNVAVGYGASGMISARADDPVIQQQILPTFKRYKQFYFSPDVALNKIKSDSKVVNTLVDVLEFIKIPLPTLEVNTNGKVIFHPIYF